VYLVGREVFQLSEVQFQAQSTIAEVCGSVVGIVMIMHKVCSRAAALASLSKILKAEVIRPRLEYCGRA
jgi:hypothetical protein